MLVQEHTRIHVRAQTQILAHTERERARERERERAREKEKENEEEKERERHTLTHTHTHTHTDRKRDRKRERDVHRKTCVLLGVFENEQSLSVGDSFLARLRPVVARRCLVLAAKKTQYSTHAYKSILKR